MISAAVLLGLAACADGAGPSSLLGAFAPAPTRAQQSPARTAQIGYVPPETAPAAPVRLHARGTPAGAVDRLAGALAAAGLAIDIADPSRGIVVAIYSGDPTPYVECGSIFVFPVGAGAEPRRLPAETGRATLDLGSPAAPAALARELRLDARLALQLQPSGGEVEVLGDATYVLTKTVRPASGAAVRDVVSFRSGESGRFARGTVCQPNGRLERLAPAALLGTA